MIEIEVLNCTQGDNPIYIQDDNPSGRSKVAETIDGLLKQGHAIFLIRGQDSFRIKGYDPESNEWLILSEAKPVPEAVDNATAEPAETPKGKPGRKKGSYGNYTKRMSAGSSRVTSVAPTSGG